ncbi:MAG: LptF/LptG family permease [Pseudomonadota bacterium]
MRDWLTLRWHATMNRITRYILRQLALSTALVVVTLTAAIWLTQSLRFVDWIVNRGLPLSTFAYIAVLVLPELPGRDPADRAVRSRAVHLQQAPNGQRNHRAALGRGGPDPADDAGPHGRVRGHAARLRAQPLSAAPCPIAASRSCSTRFATTTRLCCCRKACSPRSTRA